MIIAYVNASSYGDLRTVLRCRDCATKIEGVGRRRPNYCPKCGRHLVDRPSFVSFELAAKALEDHYFAQEDENNKDPQP